MLQKNPSGAAGDAEHIFSKGYGETVQRLHKGLIIFNLCVVSRCCFKIAKGPNSAKFQP